MKRTSSIEPVKQGARAARAAARKAEGFKPAPGRKTRKRGKKGKDFKTTDLVEVGKEIFAEDDFRDDTQEAAMSSIGLLKANQEDALQAAITTAKQRVQAGEAKAYREQQGGIVLVGEKGRIKGWVLPPAHRQGGSLAGTIETKASKQFLRNLSLSYEERARRRIEAIGKSLFQSTGGLTDERRKALTEAYKQDRANRGWKVPNL